MNKIVGYTQGTFDLFHIGHLNLLEKARSHCDYLIVGVNSDELVKEYKKKDVIVTVDERARILKALRCVDAVIITDSLDKTKYHQELNFNKIFVGNDWEKDERWIQTKKEMTDLGAELIFLPYTPTTSSTILRKKLSNIMPI